MDRRWADLWKRARFQATLFISLSQFALVSHISFGNRDTRASLGENVKIDFHILTLLALVVQRTRLGERAEARKVFARKGVV